MSGHPRLLAGAAEGLTPLSTWRANREVPVRAAFKIGRDVAEAITYLHLLGLSAGQIDSDSIFVNAAGDEAYLRPLVPDADAPVESATNRAPQRADLIELGVVLFELCCRRALRPREDLRHMRRGFALVSLTNPRVPAAGDTLITALLAPTPGNRYERAKQVLDDLRQIVAGFDGPPVVPAPAPTTASMVGRRVEELLAGWAPQAAPAAPVAPAPRVAAPPGGTPLLRRLAGALSVVLALLWVFAPVSSSAGPAEEPPRSVRASAAPKDRAALARELIAIKRELMRTK